VLKVAGEVDQILVAKTYEAGQEHVFDFWDELQEPERRSLLDQLATVDFQLLGRLAKTIDLEPPAVGEAEGIPTEPTPPAKRAELERRGWEALSKGKVACLVVAGGQGTRLGWDHPKGTFPISPVLKKSLFELFAEQVLAISRRAEHPLPWYVLTSRQNRDATEAFFTEKSYFGLPPDQVTFLVQREVPTVDARGRLFMTSKAELAMNPDGHGGTLRALREARALADMAARGVDTLFYFQVDNPLCRVADPAFIGAHLLAGAEASTKVVRKVDPTEKIGLVARRDGKTTVIEYSELSKQEQERRDASGQLTFRAGNTAIHAWSVAFFERLIAAGYELPYHIARKAVPQLMQDGELHTPSEPNAIKFETFIFDLLPEATEHVAFEVDRAEEFEPLKNKSGPYSPETVRRAQSDRAARWLGAAGAKVQKGVTYELSSLTALDADELKAKLATLDLAPKSGAVAV
jgi:UDP-N-acetylglucosamine/UDP-N-acetylgalactosamine diphosphorylase